MRCSARQKPTRARRRRPSLPRFRSRNPAISGCSAATACSAAAPPRPPTWRGCSAVCGRTSWSATRRMGSRYDPSWRNEAGLSATKRTGKVLNDDRADWREAWALFPGEVAYVWHGALHATTVAESLLACGFSIRGADHLGQGAAGALPRRLSLATRALLVRGRQGQGPLERRPQADHALVDPEPRPGRRDDPRHPEAGRVHAPADAQQQRARAGGLRAVLGIRHLDHRRRDLRPDLPLDGARPGLRRCRGDAAGRPSPARWRPSTATAAPSPRSQPSGCRREGQPGTPSQADRDPPARRQPRQARLEPRRARAARRHSALPEAPRPDRPHRVAPGCADAARDGGADDDRPGRARRLLPELRQVGRGRAAAEGDADRS